MKSFQEYLKDLAAATDVDVEAKTAETEVSENSATDIGRMALGSTSFSQAEEEQLSNIMQIVKMGLSENPVMFLNMLRRMSSNNPEMEKMVSKIDLPKLKMAARKNLKGVEDAVEDSEHNEDL